MLNLRGNEICNINYLHVFFITQQAAQIIRDVFSSFKAKLQEQRWTNETSIRMVIDKVACGANILPLYFFNLLWRDDVKNLSACRLSL